jgi:hypothetical protein
MLLIATFIGYALGWRSNAIAPTLAFFSRHSSSWR